MGQSTEADYLVIGAGSAGCVLANRLTENNESTVTLVEAGGPDRWWNWKVHMPSALAYPLADNKYNWAYFSEPERTLRRSKNVLSSWKNLGRLKFHQWNGLCSRARSRL